MVVVRIAGDLDVVARTDDERMAFKQLDQVVCR